MVKELSERQRRILEFLQAFLVDHGYPPTVRDIQRGCAISSTSVVDYNLDILQRRGYIRRSPDISRGIEFVGATARKETVKVPLLGYIAAGQPIPVPSSDTWAAPEALEELEVPAALARGHRDLFALKVRGTSMIDALVDDGDIIVLELPVSIREGDMVAAWLKRDQTATLKRLHREGDRVRLQPANSQMAPIYAEAEEVEVQGKVVAVIRNMA